MKLLYFTLFILIVSCKPIDKDLERFKKYIKTDLSTTFSQNDLYIILPVVNACNTCLELTRSFLLKQSGNYKNIHLIYVGNSKKELLFLSEGLNKKYHVIYDTKNRGFLSRVVSYNPVIISPGLSQSKVFEFTPNNNFEKMKMVVIDFINKPVTK